ncbi:MAG TPA: fluoride efflux transporter CrcB [Acidimicrobiales bacterium]|nr:fluoride efflux transporter CrcB [Acidimicrobiales bacterium]
MTPGLVLAVAAGGVVGAPARFALDRLVSARVESDLPWGTFLVNASGSLVLGVLLGLALHHHLAGALDAFLATGFCGAFTTFSTFTYETVRLLEDGDLFEALAYSAGSIVVGLCAAAVGLALASAV